MSRNTRTHRRLSDGEDTASGGQTVDLTRQLETLLDEVNKRNLHGSSKSDQDGPSHGDYDSELGSVLEQTNLHAGPYLQLYEEAQVCYPLEWTREKDKNLEDIFFKDDQFITDAVIESWYRNLQLELCGGQGDSITLERCVNLTDWGLHWLAKILSKRYHVQKVTLDGCSQITERGVLELCASKATLELSCNYTRVTSLPDIVTQQNPEHRFKLERCPLLSVSMYGVKEEEKVFGPYNKVYVHQSNLSSCKLLDSFHGGKKLSQNSRVSMVTDWPAQPPQNDDVPDILKSKEVKLNIIEASECDPSYGVMMQEEADQVVIPFDTNQNEDTVASMAARAILLNAAKEKPRLSSGLDTRSQGLNILNPLWSVSQVQGSKLDFNSGIVEVISGVTDRNLSFAEEFTDFQHTLQLEVLEYSSKNEDPAMKFVPVPKKNASQSLMQLKIQAGDRILAKYTNSRKVEVWINNKVLDTAPAGAWGIEFKPTDLQLKLKIINFNINTKHDKPQFFTAKSTKNSVPIFDPPSRTLRFAGRGVSPKVQVFSGVQPITRSNNTVTIRLVNLGKSATISLGIAGTSYQNIGWQPGWRSPSIAVHMDDQRVFNGTDEEDHVDKEVTIKAGDLIKMVVDDIPGEVILPNDKVTLTYYHNGEQIVKRQWVSITSVSEMVVPVIGMHSSGECVEIIDFAAPVPLHHRLIQKLGSEETFISYGKATCIVRSDTIVSSDLCSQGQKEYLLAGNSLSRKQSIFWLESQSTTYRSVFTMGLVQENYSYSISHEMPGQRLGTVAFNCRESADKPAVVKDAHHGTAELKNFTFKSTDRLGFGFDADLPDIKYDEFGVPCADQDLTAVLYVNDKQVGRHEFRYLGGGLCPIVNFGQPNIAFVLPGLLGKKQVKTVDLPVEPGTQYIMTGLHTGSQDTTSWQEKIEAISGKIKNECKNSIEAVNEEKNALSKKTKVTLSDHKHLSGLSQQIYNLSTILLNWNKRTHFILIDPNTKKGVSNLGELLAKNVQYSVQHHEYLYLYTDETFQALHKICELKSEKIVTLAQVKDMFPNHSRPWLVETYLMRLQRWGKVLLFLDHDPELIVTDPEWFLSVLNMLPDQPASKAGPTLPCIKAGSPIRKPRDLLRASQEKLDKNKLLQVLVESHQLLRLKPFRNEKRDPKYCLLQPSDLGPVPSETALKKYLPPYEHSENYLDLSNQYRFKQSQLLPYVWYALLARLSEICEPKMLWDEGMVWHQGSVECILMAGKLGSAFSSMELRARTFICSSKRDLVLNSAKSLLDELFTVYKDVVDATLYQYGVFGVQTGTNIPTTGDLAVYSEHNWIRPFKAPGTTVCTLCNNCCDAGLRCDFNGILDEKPMSCLCETDSTCCLDCGICQSCARKLWNYRTTLRPGKLKVIQVKEKAVNRLSDCPIDGTMLNEFEFTAQKRADYEAVGLVSEDEEFYIIWSLLKSLACPKSVYKLPMLYNHMEFFYQGRYNEDDEKHTYKVKLSDFKLPVSDTHDTSLEPQTYNFDQITSLKFCQETGIAEAQVDHWLDDLTSGYMVGLHPLTKKCFYFEAEIMATSSEGYVEIGLSESGHFSKAQYGFAANPTECLVGDLGMKQRYLHHSPVQQGVRLGVGILYSEEDARHRMFFVKNGERESVNVSSGHDLYPHVGISGKGWRVRLTTRGAWRAKDHEVHEALDMQVDKAKKAQAWASFDKLEMSPASVVQFSPVSPGDEEIKEQIKAKLFLKAKPDVEHPIVFKVKVTNLSRYVVRPNKGIIKPGDTMMLEFFGRCSQFESLIGDKFRIEWLEGKIGVTVDGYNMNSEDRAAEWTVLWTENLAKVKTPDVATLTAKISQTPEEDFENQVTEFVKNIYMKKTQATVVPRELPKVSDGSPLKPHYILEVFKDGQICSQSWLPRKKYHLAVVCPQHTVLSSGLLQVQGFNIPKLPRRSLPNGFKPGMKVYAKFTQELFAAAVSGVAFNTSLKKTDESSADSASVGKKKKGVKFSEEPAKISVDAEEDIRRQVEEKRVSTEEEEESKRQAKGNSIEISEIYGPCMVVGVHDRAMTLSLTLEWTLGSLCLVDKPKHIWRTFEVNVEDIHSELWAEKMNYFTPVNIEPTSFDAAKTVTVWKSVRQFSEGDYKWDKHHKSPSLNVVSDNTYQRTATANQTDGIRGATGVSTGVHVFRFENLSKIYGSNFQIGVCTSKAKMQMKKYGVLFGCDKNSWGWNIPDSGLYHDGKKVGASPQNYKDEFTIEMKLNIKDPNWPYLHFSIPGKEASGFVAFQDTQMSETLASGQQLFPCCGGVYGNHQVRISLVYSSLLGSAEDWEPVGIFNPKKLEPKYDSVPLPYLFPSEKEFGKFSYDNMMMEMTQKINSAPISLGKCCMQTTSQTVRQHELNKLFSSVSSDHPDLLTSFVWVPLPREMDTSLLSYPSLQDLVEIDKLTLHFLCKKHDEDLAEVIDDRFKMHFIDRPPLVPVKTLPEELCFGVPAIACAYIACLKVLLPTYQQLFPESVRDLPRKHLEHFMQSLLRLLSSLMMTNYPPHMVTGKASTDGWEAISNEGMNKVEELKPYISKHVAETLQSSKAMEWVCKTHQLANLYVFGERMKEVGEEQNVLNLSVFSPYNELLTKLELVCKDSGLEVIPDEFQTCFPNLVSLTVDQANDLKKLPANLGNLRKLETLWFTTEDNIKTQHLPDDLGKCKKLEKIRLSRAQIKQLPNSLTQAHSLSYLSMGANGLRELPGDIAKLSKLSEILLNFNPISALPDSIGKLKFLSTLMLAGVPFAPTKSRYHERDLYEKWFDNQGQDIIKALPKSQVMQLYDSCKEGTGENQVTDLHKVNAHLFYEVPRLGLDFVSGDEDGGIPEPIFQLENLETLDLSNQAIRFVPSQLSKLRKLEKLFLSKNMLLHSISGELGSMKKLRTIGLRNCPSLKTPPVEIVGRGVEATKAFLRRLSGGTTENWRTKLMLVGLGGAGKTSLLRALTSPNHKTSGTSAEEITDGIDIKSWTAKSDNDKKITFSTWDFAGQDVYYNTHQFFLSGRAVYLLLWTCRLGYQHAGLDFWLSSIQCHAPKAPIFIVGTHCDQVAKAELPKDMLVKKYPQIKGFHFVSSIKGTGIAELEKEMIQTTKQESYMGESIPTVYLKLENKIMQLRKQKKVVPWRDIEQLATECGIFELKDIKRAVTFLHDLGTVQYFDNEFLRDYVVINPQWIVDVMSCVVSVKDSPIQNGTFKHEDIKTVWKDYPVDLHEWLLRLTEEFDLTFPIPSKHVNLVPCLLPQTEPKFEWPELREGERETMMLYRFTYLPAGLFNRTQVRLFQFSDYEAIWKRGSLLKKNDHLALIKQINDKEMLVRVQGPRPENVLFLIHEVIESLVVESFSGVSYDFLIPCPDCIKKTRTVVQETALFEASLIKRAAEWNAPFLQCREHFHTLSMSVLQAYLPPDRTVEFDAHLLQSVRALENLRRSCTTDVFLLYCDADVTHRDCSVQPSHVAKDLANAGFSCHYKDNLGQTGIEEVMLGLKDSKMMVVFMSDNFEKDKQCHELFLYAKHSLNKPYQVVACGGTLNWMDTKLGGMEIGKHHVFVKMTEKKRYESKIKELEKHVTTRLSGLQQTSMYPRCFLSYAWSNSHDAVNTGSKMVTGALGWDKGDPRHLKALLEEHGITCWLDTEQTGKGGLFEDISKGILHADMMIVCVSDQCPNSLVCEQLLRQHQLLSPRPLIPGSSFFPLITIQYMESKNCMMELRYAECTLEKPLLAVVVGTENKWRYTEIQTLLHRSKAPIVSLQTPNEHGLEQVIKYTKDILASCGEKTVMKKQPEAQPSLKINNISFHEEFELAQRKLLRHVSIVAATMETMPYPRFIVLDLKKKHVEDASQDQEQQGVERPKSAKSVSQDSRPTLHKRESKQMRTVTGKDDYDPSWTENPLVVRLLCEYDGGCHVADEDVDLSAELNAAEKEVLVKSWCQYLGPVYALLKHSTVTLHMMAMEQGSHMQSFVNHSIEDSQVDFAQAYVKMRDHVMLADKDSVMGGLDRCYLPTGQIRWLCKNHQKGNRITVLSNDVDVGVRFGDAELVTEDDRLIAAHIDKMSDLAQPYRNRRSKKPRKMALTVSGLEDDDNIDGNFDEHIYQRNKNKPSEGQDQSKDDMESVNVADGQKATSSDVRPKPKPRHSLLGSKDRPASGRTLARMKASAHALQPGSEDQTSKACHIL